MSYLRLAIAGTTLLLVLSILTACESSEDPCPPNVESYQENWRNSTFWTVASADLASTALECGTQVEGRLNNGRTPLEVAARWSDDPAVIQLLIDHGASINARRYGGQTVLHMAAADSDNPEVVRVLLDNGASVHAQDDDGYTPLHEAAEWSDSPSIIQALVNGGADIEATAPGGWTALHIACLLYTSPSPRDGLLSRMPSSA